MLPEVGGSGAMSNIGKTRASGARLLNESDRDLDWECMVR